MEIEFSYKEEESRTFSVVEVIDIAVNMDHVHKTFKKLRGCPTIQNSNKKKLRYGFILENKPLILENI